MNTTAVVLANPDVVLPALGPRLASIIVSVVLIVGLEVLRVKSAKRSVRDVAVALIAFVAVFGIDGPALANQYVASLQAALTQLLSKTSQAVTGAAGKPSGWTTLYLIAIIVIAGLALRYYWRTRTPLALLVLMVLALPLLAYPDFQGISLWYINHVGVSLYRGAAAFINSL